MKYIKHLLIAFGIRLPLRLLGMVVLIPVTYKYKMGKFPKYVKWFDDYRGRYLEKIVAKAQRSHVCSNQFGSEHCRLYSLYNSSWYSRYVWTALRNTTNVFNHDVLGIQIPDGRIYRLISGNLNKVAYYGTVCISTPVAWEYCRTGDNLIKIPLLPFGLRIRLGYKLGGIEHIESLRSMGFPLEFAASIGIRRL